MDLKLIVGLTETKWLVKERIFWALRSEPEEIKIYKLGGIFS